MCVFVSAEYKCVSGYVSALKKAVDGAKARLGKARLTGIQCRVCEWIRHPTARTAVVVRAIGALRRPGQLVLDFVKQPWNVGIGLAEAVAVEGGVEVVGAHDIKVDFSGDGYELAVELVDGCVESDAHGLRIAAGDAVERVADTSVVWVEADVRKDDPLAACTFGGHERAVEGVEVPA